MRAQLIIELTKLILCSVSMSLTALFALSFSTDHLGLPFSLPYEHWIAPALMVVVGLSLDSIKYVFWATGLRSFQLASLVLVIFSWCASVAFFITQDDSKIDQARKKTPEYLAYQSQLSSLQREIRQKEQLTANRTQSQFHKQWEEGERLSNELGGLNDQLTTLLKSESSIGVDSVKQNMTSSAFFNGIGHWVQLTGTEVRNLFYAVLALLLELGSIGMVSLSYQHAKERKSSTEQKNKILNNTERFPKEDRVEPTYQDEGFNWNSMINSSTDPVQLTRQQLMGR